jgi:magnesium transporter
VIKVSVFKSDGVHEDSSDNLPVLLDEAGSVVWVDITTPSEADLALLRDLFHFHPLAIEDTRNQRQRPKVEEYADHLFIIMNSASIEGDNAEFNEIDVFIGNEFLVTVHDKNEPIITAAQERIVRVGRFTILSSGYLLYMLVDTVVDSYFPVLDTIDDQIEAIGEEVLRRPQQELLNRMFRLKRTLSEMWRVVGHQRDMFNILTYKDHAYINYGALEYYLRDVYDHLIRINDSVNAFRDILTGLIDLYLSSVSNRLNRVVNRLAVITIVIGVLTVVSGFYGMNFLHTWPPFDADWAVPFVLLLMVVLVVGVLAMFRKLKWY